MFAHSSILLKADALLNPVWAEEQVKEESFGISQGKVINHCQECKLISALWRLHFYLQPLSGSLTEITQSCCCYIGRLDFFPLRSFQRTQHNVSKPLSRLIVWTSARRRKDSHWPRRAGSSVSEWSRQWRWESCERMRLMESKVLQSHLSKGGRRRWTGGESRDGSWQLLVPLVWKKVFVEVSVTNSVTPEDN